MKKFFYLLFASILFFSCSNDDNVSDSNSETGKLVFEIAANKLSMQTRVGTPVYSQEATQNISRVTIFAFSVSGTTNTYVKTFEITNWTAGSTSYQYVVPEAEELPEGTYHFLAVGREATDLYEFVPPTSTSTIEDIAATLPAVGDEYEIFSGSVENQAVYSEGARISIAMTRSVAGVLGYFENVPQILDGQTVTSLRLTSNVGNTRIEFYDNTGYSQGEGYNLMEIDLTTQAVENGIYTGNNLSAAGIVKLPNSQLGGVYMLPIGGFGLTLGLYNAAGDPIREWPVYLDGVTTFSIQANHFYSLGTKQAPGSTTGVDPENPDDDDEAIDLLQDQVITLTVDPAWNTIHRLTIE